MRILTVVLLLLPVFGQTTDSKPAPKEATGVPFPRSPLTTFVGIAVSTNSGREVAQVAFAAIPHHPLQRDGFESVSLYLIALAVPKPARPCL